MSAVIIPFPVRKPARETTHLELMEELLSRLPPLPSPAEKARQDAGLIAAIDDAARAWRAYAAKLPKGRGKA